MDYTGRVQHALQRIARLLLGNAVGAGTAAAASSYAAAAGRARGGGVARAGRGLARGRGGGMSRDRERRRERDHAAAHARERSSFDGQQGHELEPGGPHGRTPKSVLASTSNVQEFCSGFWGYI